MHTARFPGRRESRFLWSTIERMTTTRERNDVARRQRDQIGVTLIENLAHIAGTKVSEFKAEIRFRTKRTSSCIRFERFERRRCSFRVSCKFRELLFSVVIGPAPSAGANRKAESEVRLSKYSFHEDLLIG